mgnify:FL=1
MINNTQSGNSQFRLGITLSLIANSVWGGAAFYWLQTRPVNSIDVLAHRGAWTLPAVLLVLILSRRVFSTARLLKQSKTLFLMLLAAALISVNWGTFLYAVTHGHATEASLGYFLLPILSVLLGIVIFGERPTLSQKVAIGMALLAIVVQLLAVGTIPIISLTLSLSFALYGAIRKKVQADAIQGLFIESLFLFPAGLLWILLHDGAGYGAFGLRVDAFLLLSGAFTAIPLITHVMASRLLPLSTVGLMSYVGPSLQLIVAQFFLHEQTPILTLLSFAIVWCGLAFIIGDNIRRYRHLRKVAQQDV